MAKKWYLIVVSTSISLINDNWAPFHVLTDHSYAFLYEVSVQAICLNFYEVIFFFIDL